VSGGRKKEKKGRDVLNSIILPPRGRQGKRQGQSSAFNCFLSEREREKRRREAVGGIFHHQRLHSARRVRRGIPFVAHTIPVPESREGGGRKRGRAGWAVVHSICSQEKEVENHAAIRRGIRGVQIPFPWTYLNFS